MSTEDSEQEGVEAWIRRDRRRRVALGGTLLLGGVVLGFLGLIRSSAADVGPWNTSYGGPVQGPIAITIEHEDGRVETYEVQTTDEAEAFVEERHAELRDEYGLEDRANSGRLMMVGAGVMAVAGLVLVFLRPRRRPST